MSLIPVLHEGFSPLCNNFGFGLHRRDFWISPAERALLRTMPDFIDMEPKSHVGKDGFEVSMDVQHFLPSEITVKTVDDSVIIEARHEEKRDEHGYIQRQFSRRYGLPKGYKADDVVSSLSTDGILTVKAAPPQAIEENVQNIQIQQTGLARVSLNKSENTVEVEDAKKQ